MKNGWLLAVIVMVIAAAPVGCTRVTDGRPTAGATESAAGSSPAGDECASVSAPMDTIDARGAGEPQLRIPTPEGWERTTKLDSDLIRYVMANRELIADSFAPNVVVTLEEVAGTRLTPQEVLDQQKKGLRIQAGVTDMDVTPGTVCGATAETVDYTLPAQGPVPAHPATVLIVAAPFDGNTWSASVTVQAVDADDPTYQSDASTILTGFQMLPPGAS